MILPNHNTDLAAVLGETLVPIIGWAFSANWVLAVTVTGHRANVFIDQKSGRVFFKDCVYEGLDAFRQAQE